MVSLPQMSTVFHRCLDIYWTPDHALKQLLHYKFKLIPEVCDVFSAYQIFFADRPIYLFLQQPTDSTKNKFDTA